MLLCFVEYYAYICGWIIAIIMACTSEFIDFICDTLAPLGDVRPRKMMADAGTGCACQGAKEGYILDFQNPKTALEVIGRLWEVLPFPKSRKL